MPHTYGWYLDRALWRCPPQMPRQYLVAGMRRRNLESWRSRGRLYVKCDTRYRGNVGSDARLNSIGSGNSRERGRALYDTTNNERLLP